MSFVSIHSGARISFTFLITPDYRTSSTKEVQVSILLLSDVSVRSDVRILLEMPHARD